MCAEVIAKPVQARGKARRLLPDAVTYQEALSPALRRSNDRIRIQPTP